MNLKTIAVAALLGVAVPTGVWAQATPAPSPDPQAGATQLDNDASVNAGEDFNVFLKGFSGADFTSATSQLDTAATFRVVKLSTMANAAATKMQPILDQRANDLTNLQSTIATNEKAKAALDAAGATPDQVVWFETAQGGEVTLYVSDFPA